MIENIGILDGVESMNVNFALGVHQNETAEEEAHHQAVGDVQEDCR